MFAGRTVYWLMKWVSARQFKASRFLSTSIIMEFEVHFSSLFHCQQLPTGRESLRLGPILTSSFIMDHPPVDACCRNMKCATRMKRYGSTFYFPFYCCLCILELECKWDVKVPDCNYSLSLPSWHGSRISIGTVFSSKNETIKISTPVITE